MLFFWLYLVRFGKKQSHLKPPHLTASKHWLTWTWTGFPTKSMMSFALSLHYRAPHVSDDVCISHMACFERVTNRTILKMFWLLDGHSTLWHVCWIVAFGNTVKMGFLRAGYTLFLVVWTALLISVFCQCCCQTVFLHTITYSRKTWVQTWWFPSWFPKPRLTLMFRGNLVRYNPPLLHLESAETKTRLWYLGS